MYYAEVPWKKNYIYAHAYPIGPSIILTVLSHIRTSITENIRLYFEYPRQSA